MPLAKHDNMVKAFDRDRERRVTLTQINNVEYRTFILFRQSNSTTGFEFAPLLSYGEILL